jgi:hypothetical protein
MIIPTTITCYGGVNEIGGNKILLQDGELFYSVPRQPAHRVEALAC